MDEGARLESVHDLSGCPNEPEFCNPVVDERPVYFDYQGWCFGGTDTPGYGI